MIDIDLVDLELVENSIGKAEVDFLLLEDEIIGLSFLPLDKIQSFSVETAGSMDLDSELEF